MSKKAFDKIAEGLAEVLAIVRGEATAARVHGRLTGAKTHPTK